MNTFPLQMSRQLPVGLGSMRARVFLFRRHLAVGFPASFGLEPGVPAEVLFSARLDQHLPDRLSAEEVRRGTIPVGDAALRARRTVDQGIGDGTEALAAGSFEEPPHIGAGEVAELVEAEGDILD